MEQARVQEETQMKMDHARRLKQMRLSLEDEKRKRSEENARLRRQLELKQVHCQPFGKFSFIQKIRIV